MWWTMGRKKMETKNNALDYAVDIAEKLIYLAYRKKQEGGDEHATITKV